LNRKHHMPSRTLVLELLCEFLGNDASDPDP